MSSGTQSRIRSSPPVTPASAMKEAISMWSGETACSQPPRLPMPWTYMTFEPMPSIAAPILLSMRARSCTWGSEAALRMTLEPGVSAAAMSAFSVPITDGSSMKKSVERSPPLGAESLMWRAVLDLGAERAEGVEVRVQAPAADDVAARRGHRRGAEAGQQRPGDEEGGADALGQRRVDVGVLDPVGLQRDGVVLDPLDGDAEVGEQRQHRLGVPDARDVGEHDPLVGEQAGAPEAAGPRSCCRRARWCRKAARRLG